MSAIHQLRFNLRCCLADLYRRQWHKLPFHLNGARRAVHQICRQS